jgi:hypothetical protein
MEIDAYLNNSAWEVVDEIELPGRQAEYFDYGELSLSGQSRDYLQKAFPKVRIPRDSGQYSDGRRPPFRAKPATVPTGKRPLLSPSSERWPEWLGKLRGEAG